MKLPEIEIDNQMMIETIKRLTESLTADNTIKIEIDANYKENYRDIVIRVKSKPDSDVIYSQQHFETGQKLNISFE
ncbi:hypothetical protein LN344_13465 [Lacticaseibacillus paracasei subsp. paracasei]|uniref:hypothetical protein n=1 Tax=Lacticaseibacillus paracasei TaxID=1597 RepID=UPI001E2A8C07|nr:hypothetical protein [Lacticaseibacillus paracasei]MCD0434326.1 hypothetical protein [Lacticaseibacillus paracasei subsp. paracasei]